MITQDVIQEVFKVQVPTFSVGSLGVADTKSELGVLTFLSDAKYLDHVNENSDIKAIFLEQGQDLILRDDIVAIYVDDPKWYFFSLLNHLAKNREREKTKIACSAVIHPSAVISDVGVVIGEGVVVEPNVTIYPDVIIENDVLIRAGAVLGVDGFEHKKTARGIVSVIHDGCLIVKEKSEIGPNNTVIKGFSYRDTVVGRETKLDALVHYAHGVQSGERCFIAAQAMIAGHVMMGDDVWVGPSVSISNRLNIGANAFLTIGSVVVKDVPAGHKVTGNFAIPHDRFIQNLKASIK